MEDRTLSLLCNSCGTLIQKDYWECPHCKAHYCYGCGKDFQVLLRNLIPCCPACNLELFHQTTAEPYKIAESPSSMPLLKNKSSTVSIAGPRSKQYCNWVLEKNQKKHAEAEIEVQFYRPIPDTQKVLNYLKTAKIRNIRNKQHLFQTLSNIFKKDPERIEELWYELRKELIRF